jgi:hypothetical protein
LLPNPEYDLSAQDSRLDEEVDERLKSPLVVRHVGSEYEVHHRIVSKGLTEHVDHFSYITLAESEDSLKHARRN